MSDLICAISTHSKKLNIYLFDGVKSFSFSKEILNMEDLIFEEIKKGLREMNRKFSDISVVCSVIGPGRFTGLRISYTFASVLSVISRCKVYGVDVFDLLAYKFFMNYPNEENLCVVLRAFKNEYYYCTYKNKGFPIKKIKPKWVFENDLLNFIKKWNYMIISDEEESNVYDMLKGKKISPIHLSKIEPEDIYKAAIYFKNKDIKPIYLKPAKFEL
jgi:tRNA threonylcarbamoyl adenosine modification protein YeaZ